MKNLYILTALIGAVSLTALSVNAAGISGWNTDNVEVGPPVTGTDGAASVVYDRVLPDVSAQTNGRIYYAAPEADTPGLQVSNVPYATGQGAFDGCIIATSGAACDGPFQSGKRFKQQFTSGGEMDLVFDVASDPGATIYQVFHRIVNLTERKIRDFTVELGFGVGDQFAGSAAGDGLNFAAGVELGPDNKPAFSQFPFGLFGSLDQPNPNPDYQIGGFFDTTGRAGFDLAFAEDSLTSGGIYGAYDDLFGTWISQDMAPGGLFWDWDGLGTADPLLMAWDNGTEWEVRRGVAPGTVGPIEVTDIVSLSEGEWGRFDYDDIAGVEAFLDGLTMEQGFVEDLANLNLSYAIELGDDVAFDQFTLRVEVATVPLPLSAPLLAAGLGMLGVMRRARRA